MDMATKGRKALVNGMLVEWDNANVHISTHGLLYGSGVFEGIRAYYSAEEKQLYVFRLADHVRRMLNNAKLLRLKPQIGEREFCESIVNLLRQNEHRTDVYIRPVIYYGRGGIGIRPNQQSTDYFVFTQELKSYFRKEEALDVCFSSWMRVTNNSLPPSAKVTGSYVNSMIASLEARESGFDEALFLTRNGYVCEGSGENIFMVRGKKLVTPPLSADILEGITRDTVMRLVEERKEWKLVERDIARTEMYSADEVFLCGTAAQIQPVRSIDRIIIGNGKSGRITSELAEQFNSVVRGTDKRYFAEWLTPVY